MSRFRTGSTTSLLLAAELLCGNLGQAWAGPGWVVNGTGRSAYAEAASEIPGSHLRLACEDTVTFYLYPPRGWRGAKLDDVALILDGERIAVTADGVDRGVVLSDLPSGAIGTTKGLRERMKRSRSIMIAGAASGAISRGKLTFGLEDAAGAITSSSADVQPPEMPPLRPVLLD